MFRNSLLRTAPTIVVCFWMAGRVDVRGDESGLDSPERRALALLERETPQWPVQNKCYSCHNNGDAARALYQAIRQGYEVKRNALTDTTAWLKNPDRWEENGGEEEFKDKKLAALQFSAALADAVETGLVRDRSALQRAAIKVAAAQRADGSWNSDAAGATGSPATYGKYLATRMARHVLRLTDPVKYKSQLALTDHWLRSAEPKTVLAAAAIYWALAGADDEPAKTQRRLCRRLIQRGQAPDGGWGPFIDSPSEPFDTAVVLLALSAQKCETEKNKTLLRRGREYLVKNQLDDGGWVETTRPAGAQSYAQRISTAGWATQALLATRVVLSDDWAKMKKITPKGYRCRQTNKPLKIDGRLDDDAWRAASWTDPFVDIEGDRKPRPRLKTRAKMLWDRTYFYIAAEMEEPHLWGTLTKHDSVIYRDNDFEVFIDPNGDNHQYYEFEMNALNTTWDLFLPKPYKDGGKYDNSWEIPGLKTAVHLQGTLNVPSDRDQGWSVEIAIPWKALEKYAHVAVPPRDGDQWRVNFSRVQWRLEVRDGKYQKLPNTREDNWVWSPQGIIDMHRPERWGYVQFSTAASGSIKFAPDPTLKARDLLMEIYHNQKAYHRRHKQWSGKLDELNLDPQLLRRFARPPTLKTTDEGFEASLEVSLPRGETRRLRVRQDSKIW